MLASPKCPCPNLGTGEYVTLHGNRDFTDEISLRILRYGYVPGVSSGPHMNAKALLRGRQESQRQRRRWSDRSRSQGERFENTMLLVLKMKEEAIS